MEEKSNSVIELRDSVSGSGEFVTSEKTLGRRATSSTILMDLLDGKTVQPQSGTHPFKKDAIFFQKMELTPPYLDFFHGKRHSMNLGGVPIAMDVNCPDFKEYVPTPADYKKNYQDNLYLERGMTIDDVSRVYFSSDELYDELLTKYPGLEPFLHGPKDLTPEIAKKMITELDQRVWGASPEREANKHIYTADIGAYLDDKAKSET